MSESIFYRNAETGAILAFVSKDVTAPESIGDYKLLKANSTDAAQEKHVPAITRDGDTLSVQVGSVPHPMAEDHYIQWIAVVTGGQTVIKYLKPGDEPKKTFNITCKSGTVYEFCNKHGLWKAEF